MTKNKSLTLEQIEQLENDGYSCGDCEYLEACKSIKGTNEYGFICYSFRHPTAPNYS